MTPVSYCEFDSVDGELLLPRIAFSLVGNVTLIQVNNTTNNYPAAGGQGSGQSVVDACQATTEQGTGGLLGVLGLEPNSSSSLTCVPAATTQG